MCFSARNPLGSVTAIKWLEDMFRVGPSRNFLNKDFFLHAVDNKLPYLQLALMNNSGMIQQHRHTNAVHVDSVTAD